MGRKAVDLTGLTFGELTVIGRHGSTSPVKWDCQCSCGKALVVHGKNLKTGNSTSCGCMRTGKRTMSNLENIRSHKSYPTWQRTSGDRVSRWDNFLVFLEDMGDKPKGAQLLKTDPLEPHGPENSYYRLRGAERRYPNLPWMAVDFLELERVAREATCNRERATLTCSR